MVVAYDETGTIEIILEDREIRTLIGKRAMKLVDNDGTQEILPNDLQAITQKNYSIILKIKEVNVGNQFKVFWATNICNGFKLQQEDSVQLTQELQQSTTQDTSSSYHLDTMGNLNFQSPDNLKNKGKAVQMA